MFVSEILSESEKYDIVWNGQQGANKRFNIVPRSGGAPIASHRNRGLAQNQIDRLERVPSSADKLKAKGNQPPKVDRSKGEKAAQNYLDKKEQEKNPFDKKPSESKLKKLGKKVVGALGPQRWFAPILQIYMSFDQIGTIVYNFNKVYIESGCNARDPRVNAYQLAASQEVAGIFIAVSASMAAGGGAAAGLRKIKNLKNTLQMLSNIVLVGPLVGWVARVLLFVGIEAAFYALGKVLGSSKVAEGLADWVMRTIFTKAQLVDWGGTFYPKEFSVCKVEIPRKPVEEDIDYLPESKVSKTAIKADIMGIIKDDPKLKAIIKKANTEKAKAEAD